MNETNKIAEILSCQWLHTMSCGKQFRGPWGKTENIEGKKTSASVIPALVQV